jgi:FtsP/CotA-like multicopper oxidase with cupredoxin domain
MNRGTRAGLLAVAVIILVVAFVALRPSADDPGTTADAPTATPTVADTPASEAELEEETPTPSPTPKPTVDPGPLLTGSKVQKIRVDKGETVRFRVRSPQAEEVHIHGYDIMKDVKAGQTVRISFKATIDGIFEIEFEDAAKQIAELRVDP